MSGARPDPLAELPYAAGGPLGSALLRVQPEDFRVEELPGFEPSGSGEHLFLRVRKRGLTTDMAAADLARAFGVRRNMVSYAGMKDRWAVTEQWFSLHLPGHTEAPPLGELTPGLEVLAYTRNNRKLRRGALAGNRFRLRLREVSAAPAALSARLAWIARHGVPNYFGYQRFGRDGDNVALAAAWFAGDYRPRNRQLEGILLSAARAQLFNQVLAARLADGSWNRPRPGDLMMLDGRGSVFPVTAAEELAELGRRALQQQIHPTGPLPGRGGTQPSGEVAALEATQLASAQALVDGLQRHGVDAARRALRLRVAGLAWHFPAPGVLELSFSLTSGAYATSVLRELVDATDVGGRPPGS